jgi:hypothetical protein
MLATTKSNVASTSLGVVQRAIGENVELDTPQDPEFFSKALVQPVGLAMLLLDLSDGEPPGVVRRLGIIGHAEILESANVRGFCHRLQGFRPIGRVGMTVQNPRR